MQKPTNFAHKHSFHINRHKKAILPFYRDLFEIAIFATAFNYCLLIIYRGIVNKSNCL